MYSDNLVFKGLFIHAKLMACSHSCKYCLMGDKRLMKSPSARILGLVERFYEWEAVHGSKMPVGYILNYTWNHDRATLEHMRMLAQRFGKGSALHGISFGGLPPRSEEDMRSFLLERQEFGCKTAHASLAGTGAIHDYWNGRSGNFDQIMMGLKIAGEIGMGLGARLFVTKSTLPYLYDLNEMLGGLPKHENDWRYALPFFYAGWGAKLEDERIDEEQRDNLPTWLDPLIERSHCDGQWKSEREWIAHIEARSSSQIATDLILNITEDNIEQLETMDCDDIVAEYEERTRRAYAAMPSLPELCERYGDKENRKIYPLERCIAMKWLDRHLIEHPTLFERQLTHLQMGN